MSRNQFCVPHGYQRHNKAFRLTPFLVCFLENGIAPFGERSELGFPLAGHFEP